jgi:DNA primase
VIDRSVVDQVRQRTDLVELVGQYIPLRRAGTNWIARCPFHDEKTPSFNVSPTKGCLSASAARPPATRFVLRADRGRELPRGAARARGEGGRRAPGDPRPGAIAEDRRQRDLGERSFRPASSRAAYFERACSTRRTASSRATRSRSAASRGGHRARSASGYAPGAGTGSPSTFARRRSRPPTPRSRGCLPRAHRRDVRPLRHRLMFPVFDRAGRVVAFSGRVLPVTEDMPEGIVPEDAGKYINSPETPVYKKSELLYGLAGRAHAMRPERRGDPGRGQLRRGADAPARVHQHRGPLGTSFTDRRPGCCGASPRPSLILFDGDEAGRKATAAAHTGCAEGRPRRAGGRASREAWTRTATSAARTRSSAWRG